MRAMSMQMFTSITFPCCLQDELFSINRASVCEECSELTLVARLKALQASCLGLEA